MKYKYLVFLLLGFCASCSDFETSEQENRKRQNLKGEYLYRKSDTHLFSIETPNPQKREIYPWEEGLGLAYSKITKEFFRCQGSGLNPAQEDISSSGKPIQYLDCDGGGKHSLPLICGKEGIYSILLDLLNHIQAKTSKRVIITCGHRCPVHNTYADRSKLGRVSKHMIGAEVDFYVQGLEESPQKIIDWILQYYQETPCYRDKAEYQKFMRYDKSDAHVAIKPWYNKEVYVKLVGKDEGRDFDNRHPFPYINLQVRYDRKSQKRVQYSWERAHKGYLRW